MRVNIGELDKRIQIIGKTTTRDADGYPIETESVVRECWAKFTRTSGTEMVKAGADFSEVKCRFLIRYAANISRKMTVKYNDADYEIVYINDYEDSHEFIEIWCKLLTQGG